jgi:NTP pyrophosphatase (non-canonical NTP hydrolase)
MAIKLAGDSEIADILDQYAVFVEGRAKQMDSYTEDTLHAVVGISGEAGEMLDCVKKTWVYGKELDVENLREEAGDCMFYIQMLCNQFGWTIENLMLVNMEKLTRRYPEGYSDAAAQARADKQGEQS